MMNYQYVNEDNKKKHMKSSTFHIIKEYIELPSLPMNKEINIRSIGIYNWNPRERKTLKLMKYSTFTFINSTEYPKGDNCLLDYMSDDYVCPAMIIDTDGNKYKTKPIFWLPLIDISDAALIKHIIVGTKVFPQRVFIDDNITDLFSSKWIQYLIEVVGQNIIDQLPLYSVYH